MSVSTVQEKQAPYGIRVAPSAEQRVTLHGVSWETFEALMRETGESCKCRVAYDDGELEIMAPHFEHESYTHYFEHLIVVLAREYGLRCKPGGAFLCKRGDLKKGIQSDCCFYLKSAKRIHGRKELDMSIDPPPDLMVEIDLSTDSLTKLHICAALGVPEHWRFDGTELQIRILKERRYELAEESLAFPGLNIRSEIFRFIQLGVDEDLAVMQDAFRDWIRQERKSKRK
ncbi:MAG TPA: Uma2 family endonuclease [Planctomycetota bacterium]|nr:Uma2 family endonuclease [Planctomycetota bacterium]